MGADDGAHGRHTAVTAFNVIPVEQIMVPAVFRKMLTYHCQKPPGDDRSYVLVVWGVEPYYVPTSLPLGACC